MLTFIKSFSWNETAVLFDFVKNAFWASSVITKPGYTTFVSATSYTVCFWFVNCCTFVICSTTSKWMSLLAVGFVCNASKWLKMMSEIRGSINFSILAIKNEMKMKWRYSNKELQLKWTNSSILPFLFEFYLVKTKFSADNMKLGNENNTVDCLLSWLDLWMSMSIFCIGIQRHLETMSGNIRNFCNSYIVAAFMNVLVKLSQNSLERLEILLFSFNFIASPNHRDSVKLNESLVQVL